jgi:5-methyltetrahydrofolate--homocysteine methyltransferase
MDRLGEARRAGEDLADWGLSPTDSVVPARIKEQFAGQGGDEAALAPERSPEVTLDNDVPKPPFLGSKVVKGISIDGIAEYVNETALFRNQWQFRPEAGPDGEIETDAAFKDRIRPTLRHQLAQAKAADLLVPQVVYGHFPANGDGDDLVIWTDDDRTTERTRFPFPRQAAEPWLCIADFFRPLSGGEPDYASFHIVTMGAAISERTAELFAANRYEDYLLLHGLGVEMAEALAELWHRRIREELGIADEDDDSLKGLFRQKYRGGRYSWGYPACPDLEDNVLVHELLEADRIGLDVSEETGFQFQPEQTTSAIICHHPRAKYFVV